MPRPRIAVLARLFAALVIACVIAVAGSGMKALSELKVGGPLYERIVMGKDLVADILPPPDYIIESYLEATLALTYPDQVADRKARLAQLRQEYEERRAVWAGSSLPPALRDLLTVRSDGFVKAFYAELDDVFLPALARGDMDTAARSHRILGQAYGQHRQVIDAIVADANRMNAATEAEAAEQSNRLTLLAWGVAGLALTLIVAGVIGLLRGVITPVTRMTAIMRELAVGHLDATIPETARGDEIGQMAQAMQVFKANAVEAETLRAAQERDRARAEQEKLLALDRLARAIEAEADAAVATVSLQAHRLGTDAGHMTSSLQNVQADAAEVAAASAQALANVETVAAAEELSASIGSIQQRIHGLNQATGQAATIAQDARDAIGQLSAAVDQVGEVTRLINDIASQTNLLALNATIEAARAGEAGKGFAVVAGEVKHLATQTTKATDEIGGQLTAILNTTRNAVAAVETIVATVDTIKDIAGAVGQSIDQQGLATGEIARNVTQSSDATRQVAERIQHVSTEVADTGDRANAVSTVSDQLTTAVAQLRRTLMDAVRGSLAEVSGRRA